MSCAAGCPCDTFPEACDWCWVGTPAENACPAEWCGTNDGCDCGCQFDDSDCGGGGACNGQVPSTSVKAGKVVFAQSAPLTSRVAEGMCIDDTTEGECNGQGGDFLGPGTVCSPGICKEPCTTDADRDGDVDLDDFRELLSCLGGPDKDVAVNDPSCACRDTNGDGHVDLLEFAALQVAFTGRGDPEYSPEYSNEIDPIISYFASGAGASVADDMILAGTARELVYYDLLVYGGGGGPFDVTASLYTDCPENGGTVIPGTTGTWVDIPDDGLYLLERESAPVTIPSEVWMVATFSTPESGWMIAGDAETGFTGDFFGANDPPWVCNYWFLGDPYAGFWANLECVEGDGLLLRDEGTPLVPMRTRTQELVVPALDTLRSAERRHKPGS